MSLVDHNVTGNTQQVAYMAHSSTPPPIASSAPAPPSATDRWEKQELPNTIWTRFNDRYRFGKSLLVAGGITGAFVIMFIVLGSLKVFTNSTYRGLAGIPSVGSSKYDGDSWGTATAGHFDMGGKGDGTYYDPGVGITSCGGTFTAQDMIVALNHVDYGRYADPNQSPACGACIKVTGPLGSAKATIQDMCPGCGRGSLDLSPQVFAAVGNFVDGRIPVSWTSC